MLIPAGPLTLHICCSKQLRQFSFLFIHACCKNISSAAARAAMNIPEIAYYGLDMCLFISVKKKMYKEFLAEIYHIKLWFYNLDPKKFRCCSKDRFCLFIESILFVSELLLALANLVLRAVRWNVHITINNKNTTSKSRIQIKHVKNTNIEDNYLDQWALNNLTKLLNSPWIF